VRYHDTPACFLGHVARLNRLRHCADLVHFEQQGVAKLLINADLDSLGIRDE
jgi:hypothetical protein